MPEVLFDVDDSGLFVWTEVETVRVLATFQAIASNTVSVLESHGPWANVGVSRWTFEYMNDSQGEWIGSRAYWNGPQGWKNADGAWNGWEPAIARK